MPGSSWSRAPAMMIDDDRLVMCADRDGSRRLMIGDEIVSPADVQVRAVVSANAESVVVTGNPIDDATVQHLYRWSSARLRGHDRTAQRSTPGRSAVTRS